MDTVVTITAVGEKKEVEGPIDAVFLEIERLEALMSSFKEGSDVDRINKSSGIKSVKVEGDVLNVIQKAKKVSQITDGAFDITIGPLTNLWGLGIKEDYIPSQEEIQKAVSLVDFKKIIIKSKTEIYLERKGMAIDLGGIAKGYVADRGVEVLKEKGIKAGIVAVAGDIRVFGKRPDGKPWHIGIRDPREEGKILATVDLEDSSISTSGDYERFFIKDGVRYHHIIDPKSGYPAQGCQSVTIISEKGVAVDALATGVFVLGPEKGMRLIEEIEGVEGIIVNPHGEIAISSGLKGKVGL